MNPPAATTTDETPPWWKCKYIIYDIVMHILLIVLGVATFLYVRHHKIPIAGGQSSDLIIGLLSFYCFFGFAGFILWVDAYTTYPERASIGGSADRISHIFGLALLILLLYSVSPVFALCFGIPSSLWFLFVLIHTMHALCC